MTRLGRIVIPPEISPGGVEHAVPACRDMARAVDLILVLLPVCDAASNRFACGAGEFTASDVVTVWQAEDHYTRSRDCCSARWGSHRRYISRDICVASR